MTWCEVQTLVVGILCHWLDIFIYLFSFFYIIICILWSIKRSSFFFIWNLGCSVSSGQDQHPEDTSNFCCSNKQPQEGTDKSSELVQLLARNDSVNLVKNFKAGSPRQQWLESLQVSHIHRLMYQTMQVSGEMKEQISWPIQLSRRKGWQWIEQISSAL